jgi:hypothetical protein
MARTPCNAGTWAPWPRDTTQSHGFCVPALRATAATNARAHHAAMTTTRLYDRWQSRPQESLTLKVAS